MMEVKETSSQAIDHKSIAQSDDKATLEQVRALLLSSEQKNIQLAIERLDVLERRLNDPIERQNELHTHIVPVVKNNLDNEAGLSDVLQPVVIEQFQKTSRDQPEVMAEALFPILGPAIRKMIVNLISPDKATRNRAYKLEQLLLIDKETGLPLSQVTAETIVAQDADMVSGMLSAIQSFVHDAFSADEFDGLNTLQVGELAVWIEWGPSAVLAAVVRGKPPQTLRDAMQIYLEDIHSEHGNSLRNFDGDTSQFDVLKPRLTTLLEHHDGRLKNRIRHTSTKKKSLLFAGLVSVLGILAFFIYSMNDEKKWQRYVSKLDAKAGVVVISENRSFHNYQITALKDPSVSIDESLLEAEGIDPKYVTQVYEAYRALDTELILERAKSVVELPDGVSATLNGSVLTFSGNVDYSWLVDARNKIVAIDGVERILFTDQHKANKE